MTTKTATRFPAGVGADQAVMITPTGAATLRRLASQQPVRYHWDILLLQLDGAVIDRAEIVDSYQDLEDACWAATSMNHREKARGIKSVFLVQRHPEAELPAALEF